MKFSLNTNIIFPDEKKDIKNAIILLHGYGGDGNDIGFLTINWKRFLPNTIFLCPDGHEPCSINTNGFQLFDLKLLSYFYNNDVQLQLVIGFFFLQLIL